MADPGYPEPADHGRTVRVGEYELAPGATLSMASQGPIGASEYTSFMVLDVDPDRGELDLCRLTDHATTTVSADGLAGDLDVNTFVVDDGRTDASDEAPDGTGN